MSPLDWRLSDWLGNSGKRQSDLSFSSQFKGDCVFSGWPQWTPPHASNWSVAAMSYGGRSVGLCQYHVCAAVAGFTFRWGEFSSWKKICLTVRGSVCTWKFLFSVQCLTLTQSRDCSLKCDEGEGRTLVCSKVHFNYQNSKWDFTLLIFKIR